MTAPTNGRVRRRGRGLWAWAVLAAAVVLAALVGGQPAPHGPALGPDSTGSDGAKALRLLLERAGATVDVTPEPPDSATGPAVVLVLEDVLGRDERSALAAWVRGGGTLVLADPRSPLAGAVAVKGPANEGPVTAGAALSPQCPLTALTGINLISTGDGVMLRREPGTTPCFPFGGGAFVLVRDAGAGTIVVLGGPDLWTNGRLTRNDNSVLAVALTAARPGSRVVWMVAPRVGGGRLTLTRLIAPRVKEAFWELIIAFVLAGLWRARRLGRPVVERQPVELAGSELVVAVGNLLQKGRRIDEATVSLRSDLMRELADRAGIPAGSDPASIADVVAGRYGVDRDRVLATLAGPGPRDEAGLLALAQAADAIRREVVHAG